LLLLELGNGLFVQLLEGYSRGLLFGALLGCAGSLGDDRGNFRRGGNDDFDEEALAVVRTALRFDFVLGRGGALGLQHLLQRGLVIAHAVSTTEALVEALGSGIDHGALDESARAFESRIEIECSDHGFKAVGEQHRFTATAVALFSAAEAEMVTEMDRLCDIAKMPAADQRGTQTGEIAFLKIGKGFVERLRDDETEDCVAEELELFVVVRALETLFKGERAVCHRALEQGTIAEAMLQGLLKRFQRALDHRGMSP